MNETSLDEDDDGDHMRYVVMMKHKVCSSLVGESLSDARELILQNAEAGSVFGTM
jgi:hypothetical protein